VEERGLTVSGGRDPSALAGTAAVRAVDGVPAREGAVARLTAWAQVGGRIWGRPGMVPNRLVGFRF